MATMRMALYLKVSEPRTIVDTHEDVDVDVDLNDAVGRSVNAGVDVDDAAHGDVHGTVNARVIHPDDPTGPGRRPTH